MHDLDWKERLNQGLLLSSSLVQTLARGEKPELVGRTSIIISNRLHNHQHGVCIHLRLCTDR